MNMENTEQNNLKSHPSFRLVFIRKTAVFAALLLLAANIGYRLGQKGVSVNISAAKKIVVNSSPPPSRDVDFALFWEVWSRLEQKYLNREKLDPEKMVYGAISGMVSALGDPYTVFLPPQDNASFKEDLSGAFEGIGAQLGARDDRIIVIAPLKDHPAEKSGLLAGDWIIKVDNQDTFGWTVPQAVTKIRGPKGTKVTLTLIHDGQQNPVEVAVMRDKITIKSVEFSVKKPANCAAENCREVGILKLARFGDQTNDEWNQAVGEFRARQNQPEQLAGLVLDLRNNPGGYFQSAIHIASEFVRSGVVVAQENSDGTKETYSVTRVGSLIDVPLLVLINKGSASASEIVAGALRDHQRAKLVGEKTFGKGSIQTPEDLPGGSGIHITTARWVLPNGEWINGTGIAPDIEIKPPEGTGAAQLDPQLERAIAELVK